MKKKNCKRLYPGQKCHCQVGRRHYKSYKKDYQTNKNILVNKIKFKGIHARMVAAIATVAVASTFLCGCEYIDGVLEKFDLIDNDYDDSPFLDTDETASEEKEATDEAAKEGKDITLLTSLPMREKLFMQSCCSSLSRNLKTYMFPQRVNRQ